MGQKYIARKCRNHAVFRRRGIPFSLRSRRLDNVEPKNLPRIRVPARRSSRADVRWDVDALRERAHALRASANRTSPSARSRTNRPAFRKWRKGFRSCPSTVQRVARGDASRRVSIPRNERAERRMYHTGGTVGTGCDLRVFCTCSRSGLSTFARAAIKQVMRAHDCATPSDVREQPIFALVAVGTCRWARHPLAIFSVCITLAAAAALRTPRPYLLIGNAHPKAEAGDESLHSDYLDRRADAPASRRGRSTRGTTLTRDGTGELAGLAGTPSLLDSRTRSVSGGGCRAGGPAGRTGW